MMPTSLTSVADTLQQIPETSAQTLWWFPIHRTVSLIALVLACVIFVMSYFAGGRENKNRIFFSSVLAALIGIMVMPFLIKAGIWLGILNNEWGAGILISVDFIIIAAVAVNVYEIITVTAREARPPR
jgi:hypothetical protein